VAPPAGGEAGLPRTVTVRDTILPAMVEAAGIAQPIQHATLSTKLMGTVIEVRVREGDRVTGGELLFRVDAREIEAKRTQARAAAAAAEAAYQEALVQARRFRGLYADSAATRAQLDQAETALARAEAGREAARAQERELEALGSYAAIRAPFPGTVTRRYADPGAFVAPGAPLIELQDGSRLRISVSATPEQAARLRRGAPVEALIEGIPASAVVEGVVPASAGGLYTVNALVENRAGRFLPGSAAALLLAVGQRRAVLVPARAVVREGDLTGVDLVAGGRVQRRWVQIGRARGDQVEVLAGLAGGEQVVAGE
jgi:RND family efflux transporter MFP subunit